MPPCRRSARALGRLLLLPMVVTVAACASTVPWRPSPASPALEPWQLPADAYPSQRLYRVHYQGPEGQLAFKLTLYLESAERFRMQAADGLGRQLWLLRLDQGGRAFWLNHRDGTYCWADGHAGLALMPLAQLPLAALPRLLLGRLPVAPADDLRRDGDRLSFLDARGQTWVGTLDGGQPARWSLVGDGEPLAWWQRDDQGGRPGAIFSDRRGQQQVRWYQVVAEPLAAVPAKSMPESIPADYREEVCGVAEPWR